MYCLYKLIISVDFSDTMNPDYIYMLVVILKLLVMSTKRVKSIANKANAKHNIEM